VEGNSLSNLTYQVLQEMSELKIALEGIRRRKNKENKVDSLDCPYFVVKS
jgi:hypothetical protein